MRLQHCLNKMSTLINKQIGECTEISIQHFTPEVKLHLITPRCHLWYSKPEECSFTDPFWAFYWPGGQAMTRYILDNIKTVENKRVLDIGSGCGATAIASYLMGAKNVVANDVDKVALEAVQANFRLNINQSLDLQHIHVENNADLHQDLDINSGFYLSSENFLATDFPLKCFQSCATDIYDKFSTGHFLHHKVARRPLFDIVIFGDMFYDEAMVGTIFTWTRMFSQLCPETRILFSDPGRGFLFEHPFSACLKTVQSYDLPDKVIQEHYGCATVDILEWSKKI